VTDLTAEVARAADTALKVRTSRRLRDIIVTEAPAEADTLRSTETLPGWACAAIIFGLASSLWAIIIIGWLSLAR
jgi:hypothetical protein